MLQFSLKNQPLLMDPKKGVFYNQKAELGQVTIWNEGKAEVYECNNLQIEAEQTTLHYWSNLDVTIFDQTQECLPLEIKASFEFPIPETANTWEDLAYGVDNDEIKKSS